MKAKALNLGTLVLLPAALLTCISCSSTPPEPTESSSSSTSMQKGVPGSIVVETHKVTANVTAVDAASRTVTLATADGPRTVKCGPAVANFDQIHVGDQLKATVTDEVAIYMAAGTAPPITGGAAMVSLAPKGEKPSAVMTGTTQVTATVTAIDVMGHTATLQFPNGTTRTVAVRPDVDLTQRKVGEQVVIRTTQAVAISVEQP